MHVYVTFYMYTYIHVRTYLYIHIYLSIYIHVSIYPSIAEHDQAQQPVELRLLRPWGRRLRFRKNFA